jgi:hypothetical protein
MQSRYQLKQTAMLLTQQKPTQTAWVTRQLVKKTPVSFSG